MPYLQTLQIERLVDAAAAELGSDAAASSIQALANDGARHWPGEGHPDGLRGLEAVVQVQPPEGPGGADGVAHLWEFVTRALSGLPGDIPIVPVIRGASACAAGLSRSDTLTAFQALDEAVAAAGFPAARLTWADAVINSRGDRLILDLLPDLLLASPRLCGDVRCGSGQGLLSRVALERVVAASSVAPRAPIGVWVGPQPVEQGHVVLRAVGRFGSPASRVGARAFASRMACSARRRTGLDIQPGHPTAEFDTPPARPSGADATSLLMALHRAGERVWL